MKIIKGISLEKLNWACRDLLLLDSVIDITGTVKMWQIKIDWLIDFQSMKYDNSGNLQIFKFILLSVYHFPLWLEMV